MTYPINNSSLPRRVLEYGPLPAAGSISAQGRLPTGRRVQMALVSAATRCLKGLRKPVGQSGPHLVSEEFERTLLFAAGHQPDFSLVACAPIRDALKNCQRLLGKRSERLSSFISVGGSTINCAFSRLFEASTHATVRDRQAKRSSNDESAADDNHSLIDQKRYRRLVSTLELLRYAEAELAELNLETSTVLLRATIVDVAQNVEHCLRAPRDLSRTISSKNG